MRDPGYFKEDTYKAVVKSLKGIADIHQHLIEGILNGTSGFRFPVENRKDMRQVLEHDLMITKKTIALVKEMEA